jgi:hypothetical protein
MNCLVAGRPQSNQAKSKSKRHLNIQPKVPMKKTILVSTLALFAGSILAAESDDVKAAAKKLAAAENYSWTATVANAGGGGFRRGPTEGKAQKDGLIMVSLPRRDSTTEVVKKGEKAAIKSPDGAWQSLSEASGEEGRGRFMGAMVAGIQLPSAQAEEIAGQTKTLTKEGDVYSGELTEAGAKSLLSFRGGRGGQGPEISNAKGTAKFWIKDGVLSKYEYQVQGLMNFNGNDRDIDRTTTVEIKDVGTTKLEVPDEAMKKLS